MKDLVTVLRESASPASGREGEATLLFGPGYTADKETDLPDSHGIYVAYACEDYGDCFLYKRIRYIGKAEGEKDSIRKRISNHIHDRDCSESDKQSYRESEFCDKDEIVVYNFVEYDDNLHDIEAVLIAENDVCANIHNNKGNCNTDAWHVIVHCEGKVVLLQKDVNYWNLLRVSR